MTHNLDLRSKVTDDLDLWPSTLLLDTLENYNRWLITCKGENVYLIKIYICYIGSEIIGPTVMDLGSKNRFSGSEIKVLCKYLENGKREKETLNCKNVQLYMAYNLKSRSKFRVLSNTMKILSNHIFLIISQNWW